MRRFEHTWNITSLRVSGRYSTRGLIRTITNVPSRKMCVWIYFHYSSWSMCLTKFMTAIAKLKYNPIHPEMYIGTWRRLLVRSYENLWKPERFEQILHWIETSGIEATHWEETLKKSYIGRIQSEHLPIEPSTVQMVRMSCRIISDWMWGYSEIEIKWLPHPLNGLFQCENKWQCEMGRWKRYSWLIDTISILLHVKYDVISVYWRSTRSVINRST